MTSRLMLSYLALTLVILLVLGIPLGVFFRTLEVDRLTAATERDAATLATLVEEDLETGSQVDPSVADRYSDSTGARVVVTDADGISVIDTEAPIDRDLSTRPEIDQALSGGSSTGTRRSDTLDDDLLFVSAPVASGGRVYGAVRITLGTHELDERVGRFWLGLAAMGLLVLAVAATVGWAMARWVGRPVRLLVSTAERFSTGDLAAEPEQPGAPAEIAGLQRHMNDMAEQLDARMTQQRQFVADASHQLRTPLTALRLRLENTEEAIAALGSAEGMDPDTQRVETAAAIAEVDRLSELVASLLRLAAAEHRPGSLEVADLVALTRDRADTWAALAEVEGVELSFETTEGRVDALAVGGGVEQVLDNLIDNAVSAAAERNGHVWLRVGSDQQGPWLVVADNGPGLGDEEKNRALDRFWRGDPSRFGTGLGLPIAEELLRSVGGTLSLADAPEGGLEVTVRLRSPN